MNKEEYNKNPKLCLQCGKPLTYQQFIYGQKFCCRICSSQNEEVRKKNSDNLKNAYKTGKRKSSKIVYQELPQNIKDKISWSKGKSHLNDDRFKVKNVYFNVNSTVSNDVIINLIIKHNLIPYKCNECSNEGIWNNKPIKLELHHINGDNRDNRLENLTFLCPNCHSQTENYRGRNINTGKKKVSDEDLINFYNDCGSIRQALIKAGLSPKGGNYSRIQKLIGGYIQT